MEIPQEIIDAILNAAEAGNAEALFDAAEELDKFVHPPQGTGIIARADLLSPSNTRRPGLEFSFRCIPFGRDGLPIKPSLRQKFGRRVRVVQGDGQELQVSKRQDSGGTDVFFYVTPTVSGPLRVTYEVRENATTDWVKAIKRDGTTVWEI